jgi:small conductance mechanosensitive channel
MDIKTDMLPQLYIWLADFGVKAVASLLILLIGIQVARFLQLLVGRSIQKADLDATLILFVSNLIYIAVVTMTVIISLGQLGVQTASFIAILGSIGVAVGLALQGSLSNFAAGILIIFLRPFKVGDYVESVSISGTVRKIHPLTTTLITPDNRTIIAPNRKLFDDCLINYSSQSQRRIDLVFGTKCDNDIDRIKELIKEVLAEDRRILKEPAPEVGVLEWGNLGMRFAVRPWVKTKDYWAVYFKTQESMKKRFDMAGIAIPELP